MAYITIPDTKILHVPIELVQSTALNAIAKANNSTLREVVVTLLNNNIELMLELQQQIRFIKEKRARGLEKYGKTI